MAELQRIQINENVQIRELPDSGQPSKLGIYSTDKNEFLLKDGKPLIVERDTILQLPNNHSLKSLDLTVRDKDGNALPERNHIIRDETDGSVDLNKSTPRIIVENTGKMLGLTGHNIGVRGSAEIIVDQEKISNGQRTDIHSGNTGKSWAVYYDDTVMGTLDSGRIDFIDKDTKKPLLTLDGDEDSRQTDQRINNIGTEKAIKDKDSEEEAKKRANAIMNQGNITPDGRVAVLLNDTKETIAANQTAREPTSEEVEVERRNILSNGLVPNHSVNNLADTIAKHKMLLAETENASPENLGNFQPPAFREAPKHVREGKIGGIV